MTRDLTTGLFLKPSGKRDLGHVAGDILDAVLEVVRDTEQDGVSRTGVVDPVDEPPRRPFAQFESTALEGRRSDVDTQRRKPVPVVVAMPAIPALALLHAVHAEGVAADRCAAGDRPHEVE